MEAVGTGIFVLSILGIISSGSSFVPIAIGLALMAVIYIGANVSGAHYNPAVTLALLFQKKISVPDATKYIVSQIIGALIAQWIATGVLNIASVTITTSSDMLAVFVAELIFTFALITAVFHTAVSKASAWNSYFGLAIGSIVIIGATAIGSISGGFFNPAVLIWVGAFGWLTVSILLTIVCAHIVAAYLAHLFYTMTSK